MATKKKIIPRLTQRQEKAAKLMAENIVSDKPKSKRKVLVAAGYSPETARSPAKIERKEGFQQALEKYLPADFLAHHHNDLIMQRDHLPTALKAVELAYDVKGLRSDKAGGSFSQFLQVINVQAGQQQTPTEVPDQPIDVTHETVEDTH